jgi:hypothetical protein
MHGCFAVWLYNRPSATYSCSHVKRMDIVPTPQDVCGDFGVIREQVGVGSWKGVFFKRQYAFGEKGAR